MRVVRWDSRAMVDANGLDGLLLPGWVLQLDLVQGQRNSACAEAAAESQSHPQHPARPTVTPQDGWQGCPPLDVTALGPREG